MVLTCLEVPGVKFTSKSHADNPASAPDQHQVQELKLDQGTAPKIERKRHNTKQPNEQWGDLQRGKEEKETERGEEEDTDKGNQTDK